MSRDYVLQPFRPAVDLQIDYARELNEQQYAAVTAPRGPALVIAGAGSGKTRTLTYRVAYLIEQGVPSDRILLLTFTNKAAREMMRRVGDLLGQELAGLWGGTFHSIGNRILRLHADALGLGRDFAILDREDARHLIRSCIAESGIDPKATHFPKADVLGELFSLAANTSRSLADLVNERLDDFLPLLPQIAAVQARYAARKPANNAVDFDDLLVLWLQLLRKHPDLQERYQRRFQFILVDEYQDTNKLQGDLIDLLAARHHNLMVVGDDAQSIYAWRGANYENIFKFPERYPETKIFRIETNYRSTPEILEVANAVISANSQQFAKQLTPQRKSGLKPIVVACMSASEQAAFVAQRVIQLREGGENLNQMAVLYRSHFHALELQLELARRQIPYSVTSGVRFFEQAHVKDLTAYLKLATNPSDELSFKRLAQLLPGIGAKGAERLWTAFAAACSNVAAPGPPAPVSRLASALETCAKSVPKKSGAAWTQFVATIAQLDVEAASGSASAMIQIVIDAGYKEFLKETYDNYPSRLEDVNQLGAFAHQFGSIQDFLTQLALLTNVEAEGTPASRDDDRLRLSTVHQAKGLEFDVVFIIMLCDGMFPSARSIEEIKGDDEERRLMYVAVTRARNELYLSYPFIRALPEGAGEAVQQPSRFIKEIPEALLEEWNLRTFA